MHLAPYMLNWKSLSSFFNSVGYIFEMSSSGGEAIISSQ